MTLAELEVLVLRLKETVLHSGFTGPSARQYFERLTGTTEAALKAEGAVIRKSIRHKQ